MKYPILWWLAALPAMAGCLSARTVERYRIPAGRHLLRSGGQVIRAYGLDGLRRDPAETEDRLACASPSLKVACVRGDGTETLSVEEAAAKGLVVLRGNSDEAESTVVAELGAAARQGETYELVADDQGYAVLGMSPEDVADILKSLPRAEGILPELLKLEKALAVAARLAGRGPEPEALMYSGRYASITEPLPLLEEIEYEVQSGLREMGAIGIREGRHRFDKEVLRGDSSLERLETFSFTLGRLLKVEEIRDLRQSGVEVAENYSSGFEAALATREESRRAAEKFRGILIRSQNTGREIPLWEEHPQWRERLRGVIRSELQPAFSGAPADGVPKAVVELRLGRLLSLEDAGFLATHGEFTLSTAPRPLLEGGVYVRGSRDRLEGSSYVRGSGDKLTFNSRYGTRTMGLEDFKDAPEIVKFRNRHLIFDDIFFKGRADSFFEDVTGILLGTEALACHILSSAMTAPSPKPVRLVILAPSAPGTGTGTGTGIGIGIGTGTGTATAEWRDLWGDQDPGVLERELSPLRGRDDCVFADSAASYQEAVAVARSAGRQIIILGRLPESFSGPVSDAGKQLMRAIREDTARHPDGTTCFHCIEGDAGTPAGERAQWDFIAGISARAFRDFLDRQRAAAPTEGPVPDIHLAVSDAYARQREAAGPSVETRPALIFGSKSDVMVMAVSAGGPGRSGEAAARDSGAPVPKTAEGNDGRKTVPEK